MDYDFYYDVPTRLTSNIEIDVFNNEGKVVYSLQKYHKNVLQKLLAFHFTTWFINVSLKDMEETILENAEVIGVAKRKWLLNGLSRLKNVTLTDTIKFKMTERKLEFHFNGRHYVISKQTGTQQTTLYEEAEPIAIMEESSKFPPRTNGISFVKESRLPETSALCMHHLFEIGV
ncbi:tubby C-terminal domain-like protein [Lentibacillus saliphilus]|uniref:tubby C-terminal domain-like protein n=1 Tax=Lentibacillus saliphilus TaxID=2737028 RepID=UPI001C2F2C40|nr:hypothetical protein [Lentibacillus saliphilus]